jgi:hypothetical protein
MLEPVAGFSRGIARAPDFRSATGRGVTDMSWIGSIAGRIWRAIKWLFVATARFAFGLFLGLFLVFFIPFVVLSTPRVQAYRDLHPESPVCKQGLRDGWPDIASTGLSKVDAFKNAGPDAIDVTNDENALVDKDAAWATRLRCAVQKHVIPSVNGKPIEYYLSFLEFQESGDPYPLMWHDDQGDRAISSEKLQELLPPDYLTLDRPGQIDALASTQLDVLRHHLAKSESNYVIVFAHGWRHNASVGDQNVADLRLYAAHAVRFLAMRCETEGLYCNTSVTAIYVGWRGARVDEAGLARVLGSYLGETIGGFAAGATLFDRKPVSEQIAPGAISALRVVEKEVLGRKASPGSPAGEAPINKMIVFGHSLGGNLFATGLKDDLVKSVRRHKPGEPLPPVLGNLLVLVNPAAEAAKWTAIQREVWGRIAYNTDSVTPMDVVQASHEFFPGHQTPVVVSVTAAQTFPAGGLRGGDCEWIDLKVNDKFAGERNRIGKALGKGEGMFREGIDYDFATHDLFPAFKFNFKPLASWLDRWAAHVAGLPPAGKSCKEVRPGFWGGLISHPTHFFSKLLRDFPFQSTNDELSRTIGNLDPVRPAGGVLVNKRTPSSAPFGTTHELFDNGPSRKPQAYASLADAKVICPPANYWLSRARLMEKPYGTNWDSSGLGAPLTGVTGRIEQSPPALQFLHGFNLAGQQPITRANDPFWNMRALDALSRHDGYRLSSFICAMNQLVMDEVTVVPAPGPPKPPPP